MKNETPVDRKNVQNCESRRAEKKRNQLKKKQTKDGKKPQYDEKPQPRGNAVATKVRNGATAVPRRNAVMKKSAKVPKWSSRTSTTRRDKKNPKVEKEAR